MQSCDLLLNPTLITLKPQPLSSPTMNEAVSSPIHPATDPPEINGDAQKAETNCDLEAQERNPIEDEINQEFGSEDISSRNSKSSKKESNISNGNVVFRRERPTRACTTRPAKYVDPPVTERRQKSRPGKREKEEEMVEEVENEEGESREQCCKSVTPLVNEPTLEQVPRWKLRSMWELASILNFFNVLRPLLNITVEFSVEELESALLNPNATLGDIHIPLLKAIPPVTRMACSRDTWVTVLCRKLRDWWQWVAEGELPIVTSQGAEIEMYKNLDPGVRVVILKALCDIRVEQDDIRSYIDNSLKHGVQLSAFRKERIGGDSHGIFYWFEDDEIIGHRLYREIRKVEKQVEVKKGKSKGSRVMPSISYEWETVATNLDEFLDVTEKLFSSKNRTEASLGKKLKSDMLPEIEKIHKRKERLLKKQQREALLLNNFVAIDGLTAGRSLRDRKPVTYTFDAFDRSINEAITITKHKQSSPKPVVRREGARSEPSANGRSNGSSHASVQVSFDTPSPIDDDEMDEDHESGPLDRSNRLRQRPQRYSEKEFVEAISDNDEDFDSDYDIVGEVVYDDEYMRQRKHRKKLTSSSEGEGDEYHWSEDNVEDEAEEEEEDEEEDSPSEDSDRPSRRFRRPERGQIRRGAKSGSVRELQAGLRRSKRASRTRINYQQYEFTDSENELKKPRRENSTDDTDDSMDTQDSEGNDDDLQTAVDKHESQHPTSSDIRTHDDPDEDPDPNSNPDGVGKRGLLDLNELAPGSCFEDGSIASTKIDDDDVKGE